MTLGKGDGQCICQSCRFYAQHMHNCKFAQTGMTVAVRLCSADSGLVGSSFGILILCRPILNINMQDIPSGCQRPISRNTGSATIPQPTQSSEPYSDATSTSATWRDPHTKPRLNRTQLARINARNEQLAEDSKIQRQKMIFLRDS